MDEFLAASDKAVAAEEAWEHAKEVANAIEEEDPETPEAEADRHARMQTADAEVERLEQANADADLELEQTLSRLRDAGQAPAGYEDDPDDDDGDDGWPTSPEDEPT